MGKPIDIANAGGYVCIGVDTARGVTVTLTCTRCDLERDDRHARPDDIAGWVAATATVETALHRLLTGCTGTLDATWQLTRPIPDADQGPQATRRVAPDTWEGVA